jgi:hypothetical protein
MAVPLGAELAAIRDFFWSFFFVS